jgi:ABC-type oligopeptide transport system ATPase subunit
VNRLLEVTDLTVTFPTDAENVAAVRGLSYHVEAGEVVAIVGESGSGKSAAAMAVIGLLPEYAEVTGSVRLHGDELLRMSDKGMSAIRGKSIGTVFQDPMSPKRSKSTSPGSRNARHGPAPSNCSSLWASPSPSAGSARSHMSFPVVSASGSSSRSRSPTTPTS